eukprot:962336_1
MDPKKPGLCSKWRDEQLILKQRLVLTDDFNWSLSGKHSAEKLSRIGGVDISFSKDNGTDACAGLVVLSYPDLNVIYEDFRMVRLTQPYISGYLAFREVEFLVDLLNKLRKTNSDLLPEVILVDGNGILHHRGFGLACHLGVLTNIPTVGIGKTLLHIDGLEKDDIRPMCREKLKKVGDSVDLRGRSGTLWGKALKSTKSSRNPIFVSVGHKISISTAMELVERCCKFRIPEPVRQADLRSRAFCREFETKDDCVPDENVTDQSDEMSASQIPTHSEESVRECSSDCECFGSFPKNFEEFCGNTSYSSEF